MSGQEGGIMPFGPGHWIGGLTKHIDGRSEDQAAPVSIFDF